jgi:phenylacetic acid degradation operon negative regulatory protein
MSQSPPRADDAAKVPKLTARSTILSALLGVHPPEAPVSQIIAVARIFDLQESAVRVALTRMVAAGDLDREDGVYRLSPRLLARQERQDSALRPRQLSWDGHWRMVVVTTTGEAAAERAALRETFRQLRFRDLRDGVWTRPDNLAITLPASVMTRSQVFSAVPAVSSHELADSLFQPRAWAAAGEQLLARFHDADTIAARFEVAAEVVRHILNDPMLPAELSPPDWPGERLRRVYSGFRREFAEACGAVLTSEFVRDGV